MIYLLNMIFHSYVSSLEGNGKNMVPYCPHLSIFEIHFPWCRQELATSPSVAVEAFPMATGWSQLVQRLTPGRLPHLRKPTKNWCGAKEFVSPWLNCAVLMARIIPATLLASQNDYGWGCSSCSIDIKSIFCLISCCLGWYCSKKPPTFGKKTMKSHIPHGFLGFPHGFPILRSGFPRCWRKGPASAWRCRVRTQTWACPREKQMLWLLLFCYSLFTLLLLLLLYNHY